MYKYSLIKDKVKKYPNCKDYKYAKYYNGRRSSKNVKPS